MGRRNTRGAIGCFELMLFFFILGAIGSLLTMLFNLVSENISVIIVFVCIGVVSIISWVMYEYFYFKSDKFCSIRNGIIDYIRDCNELNEHIEDLKNTYINFRQTDYGLANYTNTSVYQYKRPELKQLRERENVIDCSLIVCRGARQQPFKYICKYFNIKADEETLTTFEQILNNFSAAEQGKILLRNERDQILTTIQGQIPLLIRTFSKRKLIEKLGFDDIDLQQLYFPRYLFRYISGAGNSSQTSEIVLDLDNLDRFVNYLAGLIKFRKSIAGQRALMTTSLREEIKRRDNFSCQYCGISTYQEPNLLLEIDHIIPLSKKGMTTKENLQTLCWKCNRTKGGK